jgi:outer membrane immunogenic protein
MKKLLTAIAALGLVGTPAFAADMAVKAPPPAPEPVYSWTGFYAGVNAGWSWGNDNTTVNFPGPTINSILLSSPNTGSGGESCPLGCTLRQLPIGYQETTHPNGAIGGGQIGYNWQTTSNWIFGVEADFQASGENASGNAHQSEQFLGTFEPPGGLFVQGKASDSISQNDSLLWFGTVRGRVGYAIWPTVMLYGTGGLAYGRLNESVSASFNASCTTNDVSCAVTLGFLNGPKLTTPISLNQGFEAAVTKTGWTVGGGIEGAVPDTHFTWKVEYLYMDLGTENYTFNNPLLGTILVSSHFTDNILRVGLNYQFH